MTSEAHSRPILRAALGIAALVVIIILANWLMTLTSVGKKGADFTADSVHTLSSGTKSILKDLDAPVVVRYYATVKSEALSRDLKLYMRKVDDFLRQYASLSGGKLRLERLDPQPDTDAEDSANLDGMQGQRVVDGSYEENIFHGVAITCLDQKETIPFLNPVDETRLEYELSRAIAQVSQPKKPVIGIMSPLPISGGPAQMPGQRPSPPWAFYQQLSQSYEVRSLGMTPESLDPEEITVLILLHPAGITPEAEFQVDQFLLKGGTVVACLDPHSAAAQFSAPPQNPMMGGTPPPQTASTLPTLLEAWGVEFSEGEVLSDSKYRTPLARGQVGFGVLSLTREAMPNRKDDLITQGLNDALFYLPGGFTVTGGKGLSSTSLLRSSRDSGLVDAFRASRMDQSLITSMPRDDQAYDLVVRLGGTFKTAFPDGDPAKPDEDGEEEGEDSADETAATDDGDPGTEDATDGEPKPEETKTDSSLKESAEPGSVFLISDVDFIFDQIAYQPAAMGNMRVFIPVNGNSVLLFNILDQATGSKHLIGSRSRASTRRPFTLIQEMEARSERKVGDKKAKVEEELKKANERLSELQSQKTAGTEMFASPEQQAEITKLRQKVVEINREIRGLEKDLKREKDALSATVIILNVLVIPISVAIIGTIVCMRRRSTTVAR